MVINARFVPFPNYARVITRLAIGRAGAQMHSRRVANGTIPQGFHALSKIFARLARAAINAGRDGDDDGGGRKRRRGDRDFVRHEIKIGARSHDSAP